MNYQRATDALDDLDRAERAMQRTVRALQEAGMPVHAAVAGDIYLKVGSLSDRLSADVRKYPPGT